MPVNLLQAFNHYSYKFIISEGICSMTSNTPVEKEKNNKREKKNKNNKELGAVGIILIVVTALVVIGGAGGGYLVHLSNTSPEFCATCHVMQPNVTSYLTSNHMDNIHQQANVECKDCHDYTLKAEITSGIKFLTGNYTVGTDGELSPVSYTNTMCLECHISNEYVAKQTDFLLRNPHDNHNGMLSCKTCHISHGEQIDYCSQCHENGGQRMTGEPIEPRGTITQNTEIIEN